MELLTKRPKEARSTKYPYDKWISGSINLLRTPEDFPPGEDEKVRHAIYAYARRHDFKVFCRRVISARGVPSIVIWGDQAVPRTSPLPREIRERLAQGNLV